MKTAQIGPDLRWTNAILFNHLHVWLPTELDSTQSCCHYLLQISFIICCVLFSHPFIPVNAFLECCILFVCFFWLYYEMYIKINHIFPVCICCIPFVCFFWLYYEKCTSTLITYFQFVSAVFFLYTSSYCCIQKEYIKINHISCVYFLCIHQIYIRYNGVDLCTLFVNKLCTNHLHIFVRELYTDINMESRKCIKRKRNFVKFWRG